MDIPPPPGQRPEDVSGGHESYFGYEAEPDLDRGAAEDAHRRVVDANARREEVGVASPDSAPTRYVVDGVPRSSYPPLDSSRQAERQQYFERLPQDQYRPLHTERIGEFLGSVGMRPVPILLGEDLHEPAAARFLTSKGESLSLLNKGKYCHGPDLILVNGALQPQAAERERTAVHEEVHGNQLQVIESDVGKQGEPVANIRSIGPAHKEYDEEQGRWVDRGSWFDEAFAGLVGAHYDERTGGISDEPRPLIVRDLPLPPHYNDLLQSGGSMGAVLAVNSIDRAFKSGGESLALTDKYILIPGRYADLLRSGASLQASLGLEAIIDKNPDVLPALFASFTDPEGIARVKSEIDKAAPGAGLSNWLERADYLDHDLSSLRFILQAVRRTDDLRELRHVGSVSQDYFRDRFPGHAR